MIPLTKGAFAIVDDDDFERLSQFRWHLGGSGYAVRSIDSGRKKELLHRVVVGATDGEFVDHIDGVRLDDRKSNLRKCTHAENMHNQSRQRNGSSQFKGVTWHSQARRWQAQIRQGAANHYIGLFASEIEAAAAYDTAAGERFGTFARLNFPNRSTA